MSKRNVEKANWLKELNFLCSRLKSYYDEEKELFSEINLANHVIESWNIPAFALKKNFDDSRNKQSYDEAKNLERADNKSSHSRNRNKGVVLKSTGRWVDKNKILNKHDSNDVPSLVGLSINLKKTDS
ncbi:hypothetical protein HELRODRAFT_163417 [Helobdella robusta]|uniref:Uncharacterized protein n=1 Tax=Helobdella robusta TaxID=6412 RepID=T1EU08_HELRO|nr:hypothetical protein HELRODRAFT_163417 [Helobdella robusta]ESN96362.1 hypothetical protein HELRODRAFT_163417 [Helobdella robusta]